MFFHLLTVNPTSLFNSWKSTAFSWLNAGIDNFLIPLGIIIAAGVLVYNLVKIAKNYSSNRGEDLHPQIVAIIVCAIIIGILSTKALWWGFIIGGTI